jgi:septal ring factor EnvC (AmiA/AmiB activator)
MMTLEEAWENLRQDPEIKATMEEVEKSYKLFKKIENLIIADLEAKLAESEKDCEEIKELGIEQFNSLTEMLKTSQEECDKLKQQLAEKDIEIERLKQNYDEVWEDTYFSVREDFELNNNCNECRRCYAEEFGKQLAEKDQAIEGLQEINKSLGQTCNNDAKEIERLREQLAEEKNRNKKLNHEAQKYYEDAYCNGFQNQ